MATKPATIKQEMIAFHHAELQRHRGALTYATQRWGEAEVAKAAPGTKVHDAKDMIPFHEAAIEFLTA